MANNIFESVKDVLGNELITSNSESSESRALFIENISKTTQEAILKFIRERCKPIPAGTTVLTVSITNIGITTDALYANFRGHYDSCSISPIQEMKLFDITGVHLFVDSNFETPVDTLRAVSGVSPDKVLLKTDADIEFGTISLAEVLGESFSTDFSVVAPPDTDTEIGDGDNS